MIDCPYRTDTGCQHVNDGVGELVIVGEDACSVCIDMKPHVDDRKSSYPVLNFIYWERKNRKLPVGEPPYAPGEEPPKPSPVLQYMRVRSTGGDSSPHASYDPPARRIDDPKKRLTICEGCPQWQGTDTKKCRAWCNCKEEDRPNPLAESGMDCPRKYWRRSTKEELERKLMNWAIGITTVVERKKTTLQQTINSLALAGFPDPWLFVDGCDFDDSYPKERTTFRSHRLRPWGNWVASMLELYIRNPKSERYMMVQDDVVFYRNTREYLDAMTMADNTYWNLHTASCNERIVEMKHEGFMESKTIDQITKLQAGKGALALAFSRDGLMTLLTSRYTYERFTDQKTGWKNIDGGVVTLMNAAGWREHIHNPTLTQHIGDVSSIVTVNPQTGDEQRFDHPKAITWRGEEFDALEMLR